MRILECSEHWLTVEDVIAHLGIDEEQVLHMTSMGALLGVRLWDKEMYYPCEQFENVNKFSPHIIKFINSAHNNLLVSDHVVAFMSEKNWDGVPHWEFLNSGYVKDLYHQWVAALANNELGYVFD